MASTRWRDGGRGRAALALLVLALLTTGCGRVVTLELPTVAELDAVPRTPAVPSVVLDADGGQLAELRREYRDPVSLDEVPAHVVDAVLTAEDRRFHDHAGIDARAVARAALANAAAGEVDQGGSTITQQLVKQLYLPDADRTTRTKVHEALLARRIEEERSKAEILEDYLNTIYFGEGAYGIGAAAWTYFRAEAADLDLHQGALLAAIIRAPEAFAPTRAEDEAVLRRDDVLVRMAEDGHITAEERDAALDEPIEVHGRPSAPETREPHWVDLVVRTLLDDPSFGATPEERADRLHGGGLVITTTLQPDAQEAAREALARHLPDPDDPDAAVAAVDPRNGHVVAATGNRAYGELEFDLATQSRRQPGSTFKSFVLAAAIADGWHPDDTLDGRQGVVQGPAGTWEVANFDRRSYPDVTLRGATRASVNSAYARLGIEVGLPRVAQLARAMGVRSPVPAHDLQLTIGGGDLAVSPLDLAAGYATIGNLGVHVPTTVVERIEDREGTTVWLPPGSPAGVLSPSAAYVTAEVLQEAVEDGTGRAARVPGWQVAGKTGTTSDHADAWFVGTTPVLAAAVWLGHVEGSIPLVDVQGVRQVTGGSIPAATFATFAERVLADVDPVPFELDEDHIVTVALDPATGMLAADWCPGEVQQLPRVLVPDETCPRPADPRPQPSPPPTPVTPGEDPATLTDSPVHDPAPPVPPAPETSRPDQDEDVPRESAARTPPTSGAPDPDGPEPPSEPDPSRPEAEPRPPAEPDPTGREPDGGEATLDPTPEPSAGAGEPSPGDG